MQTGSSRGMQTLEQALVDLVKRGVVSQGSALSRSSRPEQLRGLMQRSGIAVADEPASALRVAGS
jgi:Tfp pilus assembly pilus retraction ATPase PilT